MKSRYLLVLIILCGFFSVKSFAQETAQAPKFLGHWNVQINGGITQYFGDLNKDNLFNSKFKPGFGGALGYQFSPVFGVRGQFFTGSLYSEHKNKAIKLSTDLWDASLQPTININELFGKYNPNRFVNLYVFTGFGITSFTSVTENLDTGVELNSSGSRQNGPIVPVGAGLEFRVSQKLGLNIEYGDRITFSDEKLDFFEASKSRDQYSYASFGLSYKFGGPKDTDRDGVKDKDDYCPDRAGKVELAGCPDKDNDGVADDQDDCPEVAGKVEFKGCPDKDGDGIPDKDDACPDASGNKDMKGCPDQDHDGIADKDDKCPDVSGKKELNGCPDKDGDGIADKQDKCPDIAGLTTLEGCPDKDGDGVADYLDKCPEVAGSLANNGCPLEEKVLVNEVVYFNTDNAIVIASYNQLLNKISETLKDNPGIRISVDGHTDSRESKHYNMQLSEKRADYVVKFFTDRGIDKSRIEKAFYGETRPAADNATAKGMALNRRVEIKSIK